MRRPPLAVVIPTYGIEDFKRKGKTSFLYRQLDGSYIGIAPCTCIIGKPIECPIDHHRIPAVLRNPMW